MTLRALRRDGAAGLSVLTVTMLLWADAAGAGPVKGQLQVARDSAEPSPEHDGFWSRQALLVRPLAYDPRPEMVVVLEGVGDDGTPPPSKPVLELSGERLWPPVLPVLAGWDIVIKNGTRKQHTFMSVGSDALKNVMIPKGGDSNAKFAKPAIYKIAVAGQPHYKAVVLALPTRWYSRVDGSGNWKLDNIPDGTYKIRVFYREGWLKMKATSVTLPGTGDAGMVQIGRDLELEEGAPMPVAGPPPAPPAPNEKSDKPPAKKDDAKKKGK